LKITIFDLPILEDLGADFGQIKSKVRLLLGQWLMVDVDSVDSDEKR
jgi:hypothetical protein